MTGRRTLVLIGVGASLLILGVLFRARSSEPAQALRSPRKNDEVISMVPGIPSNPGVAGANLPPASVQKRATTQEVVNWLRSFYPKHAEAFRALPSSAGRFEGEQALYFREARLAAYVFPAESESIATPIALNTSDGNRPERYFAIATLALIARATGSATALTTLQTLLQDADKGMADAALAGIAGTDPKGSRKSLYWDACRRFSPTAYEIVSVWHDSGTISQMNSLNLNGKNSYAIEVLKRMDILAGAKAEETLAGIVRTQDTSDIASLFWALAVAKDRQSPSLLTAMRERLDIGMVEARDQWGKPGNAEQTLEQAYSSKGDFIKFTGDSLHDHVLLALWEAGGQLSNLEKARLRTFGYACDPRRRLEELMAEK